MMMEIYDSSDDDNDDNDDGDAAESRWASDNEGQLSFRALVIALILILFVILVAFLWAC